MGKRFEVKWEIWERRESGTGRWCCEISGNWGEFGEHCEGSSGRAVPCLKTLVKPRNQIFFSLLPFFFLNSFFLDFFLIQKLKIDYKIFFFFFFSILLSNNL